MKKKIVVPDEFKRTYDSWHYSPAVESGGFLFVSGCTGTRADGTNSEDVVEQFREAFELVELSLTEVGLTFDDVVDMTTYHVGVQSHLKEFSQVKDEFIHAPYPAWTAIGVTELAVEGAQIEIKVVAKL